MLHQLSSSFRIPQRIASSLIQEKRQVQQLQLKYYLKSILKNEELEILTLHIHLRSKDNYQITRGVLFNSWFIF